MLSVQSVNLMNRPAFRGYEDYAYSKEAYESDKSKLEGYLDDLNDVIENTDVPKPIRGFGKVVSVGIGAGLGFVSMKYGAQGISKLIRGGAKYVENLAQKLSVKSSTGKLGEFCTSVVGIAKSAYKKVASLFSGNEYIQKVNNLLAGLKDGKVAKKVIKINNEIASLKPVKFVKENAAKLGGKIKSITGEQVENGFVNVMAVSGGVSGGVTALQEATKE